MVGFDPTPEQEALREMAHKFAANEIRPKAAEWDRDGVFPLELFRKAFDLGLMTGFIPESLGGQGLSIPRHVHSRGGDLLGLLGRRHLDERQRVSRWGRSSLRAPEEQKRTFVVPFATEFRFASFCLTEPGAGSDAGGIATTARRDGDGYVLNGRKCFITNGAHASQYTVFASTDRSRGHRGLSAFVVPRETPGVSSGKKEDKMGQRASETSDVLFEDVRVPEANRLGAEGEGFKIAMRTIDYARAGVAAMAVGVARAAYEHAAEYGRQRVQFGQPIAMNQAIYFLLADMATDIEAARLLTWKAAWLADQGKRNTKESSFAKAFAADLAMRVTTDAVQIFGGYGYMKDYPVEKLMRDAKLLQIYEGTSQIQRMVIAKETLLR